MRGFARRLACIAALLMLPTASLAQQAGQAAETQFAEAEAYHNGTGVLQNYATAARLYRQAADQGHAGAQNRLGQYFHAGLGGTRDQQQALHWLQAAADQGDPQHLFDLAWALERGADGSSDPARAATLYQQASDGGHQTASINLGVLYQQGTGVEQDFQRAAALFAPAAEAGLARAQNNLGLLHVRGTGVAQDYARAATLFTAAAEQGLAIAMTNLSVMYANGYGVVQSDTEAEVWARRASQLKQQTAHGLAAPDGCLFDPRLTVPQAEISAEVAAQRQQAATAGDPVAQFLLGWQLCTPTEASIADPQQAARWFRAAAQSGHGPSMANLGLFYSHGRGVIQDYVLAYMWLTLANSAGAPQAMDQAQALHQRMTAAQITEAQNRALQIWQGLNSLK